MLRDALLPRPIARKLDVAFDPARLQEALAHQREAWWARHAGPYHDGNWESISIWAPNGNLFEQRSFGGPFGKTVAALVSPYFWQVAERFGAQMNRVRLLRLRPGGHILRHSDPLHEIAEGLVRLHVPVTTNPGVHFLVNDRRVHMQPGETWHVDVRFPHEVVNRGEENRVHLVLDVVRNAAVDAILRRAQPLAYGSLFSYYVRQRKPRKD